MGEILKKKLMPLLTKAGSLQYILLGIFSGLCNFLFINSVTRLISAILSGSYTSVNKDQVIIFVSIILLFVWTRKTLALKIIVLSQTIFWRLRKQVLSLALNSNYQQLFSRRGRIQTALINDVNTLTDASINIINFFTSVILAIACLIYEASISFLLFSITLFIALVGVGIYYYNSKKNVKNFELVRNYENLFFENYRSIIDGFKEIYMDPKKGKNIYDNKIKTIANDTYESNTIALTGLLNNSITGQILFYILISSILLFFSVLLHVKTSDMVSFVFTLMYLLGSVENIMVLLPSLMKAKISYSHLINLTEELSEGSNITNVPERYISKNEFEIITVKDLTFHHENSLDKFGLGPVDFNISKGEVVFLFGGNGSGKTTFLYAVMGLFTPLSGEIRINNKLVNKEYYSTYRTAFSVVFSDFYLFKGLTDIENINMKKWNYYLDLFEMQDKVSLIGSEFSTTNLSTGQRKRLALIASLLEQKPILVLDEWAADQDPYFRKKFYTEIIPLLKNEGFTILAITHDDKYFNCADRLYKMDFGKITEIHNDILNAF